MAGQRKRRRGFRRFLKDRTYVYDSHFFFRSKRGFRLLAAPRGVSAPEPFSHFEKVFVYVTPGWWVTSWVKPSKVFDAIVVPKVFGRFGNQTLQLAHAVAIARAFGSERVICPGNEILHRIEGPRGTDLSLTTMEHSIGRAGLRDLLRGVFLSRTPSAHLVGNFFYTTAFDQNTVTPEARTAGYQLIKDLRQQKSTSAPLRSDHLVIHLRGGDAFGPDAHNEYGQPPLAFYQLVLGDHPWSEFTIVTADDANPVLPHIVATAKKEGIPTSIQSGSLQQDTEFLLAATTLVSSRSTFIPAITAFSENANTVYVFGDEIRFPTHLNLRRIIDEEGTYWNSTCQYNWKDEPWQRELMINYPASNLTWSPQSPQSPGQQETFEDGEIHGSA